MKFDNFGKRFMNFIYLLKTDFIHFVIGDYKSAFKNK